MGKKLQNKAETITIRVTEETRNQAESIYKRSGTSSTFASFLGDMVNLGIKVREKIETRIDEAVNQVKQDESPPQEKEAQ
jgi:DNA-directed RNA polymerase beta' subunit